MGGGEKQIKKMGLVKRSLAKGFRYVTVLARNLRKGEEI
jgi:hypothetical protein